MQRGVFSKLLFFEAPAEFGVALDGAQAGAGGVQENEVKRFWRECLAGFPGVQLLYRDIGSVFVAEAREVFF